MPHIITYLEKILDQIANILLPKEKLVKELERLGPNGLFEKIPRANNLDLPAEKMKALFSYRNNYCRQAIWELKFRGNKKLIHDFSLLLYEFIIEELNDLKTFHNFTNIILIPIPSSKTRQRERGFNQCVLLCRELIRIDKERKSNNFTLIENLLIKKEETAHQSRTKNREQRFRNLQNSFSIRSPEATPSLFDNHSFILIDDVITTGATMGEAFRVLKQAGVKKIIGFALAH
jgi:competence protein ComFC